MSRVYFGEIAKRKWNNPLVLYHKMVRSLWNFEAVILDFNMITTFWNLLGPSVGSAADTPVKFWSDVSLLWDYRLAIFGCNASCGLVNRGVHSFLMTVSGLFCFLMMSGMYCWSLIMFPMPFCYLNFIFRIWSWTLLPSCGFDFPCLICIHFTILSLLSVDFSPRDSIYS